MKKQIKQNKVFFIIGSGRCGTRTFYRMLAGHEKIEIHHEYLCTHVQPLGVLYYLNFLSISDVVEKLSKLYLPAVTYSSKEIFIDSSNKITWLIEPMFELFPQAKFLAIARDGRKVVASFFYKLKDEIYDDKSTKILLEWYLNPHKKIMPPPEKKYWWNIPPKDHPLHKEFLRFSRFERICYHWQEAYRVILKKREQLGEDKIFLLKLEDIISSELMLKKVFEFLQIEYNPIYFEFLKKPKNVFFPMDFKLTPELEETFWKICGEIMEKLGYKERNQYEVKY